MTHVVLASDEGYLDYAACTIRQVGLHGATAAGVILLVPPGIPQDRLATVRKAGVNVGEGVRVVELPDYQRLVSDRVIARRDHVSPFTYSKLMMPDSLPDIDEVLYLDVDTLVRDSIDNLLGWSLHHPLGAVHELGSNGVHLFGSTRVSYFNAGVLRMSLDRMRAEGMPEKAMAILSENPRLPFQDQDVFNLMYRDRHDVIPLAYNVFDSVAEVSLPSWKVLHDPAIVHFVGPTKPWHVNATSAYAREWRAAHARAIGLAPRLVDKYVEGAAEDRRDRLSVRISGFRHSGVGRTMRGVLPLQVKHTLNMAVLKVIPPKTRLSREVFRGLSDDQSAAAPASAAIPIPNADRRQKQGQGRTGIAVAVPRTRSAPPPSLTVIFAAARSGTNALNSLIQTGFPDVDVEGEFYFGQLRERTRAILEGKYEWIGSATPALRSSMSNSEREQAFIAYRDRMSDNVLDVTRDLVEANDAPTVVKIFSRHLREESLEALVAEMTPRAIIVQRRLAFSYISLLKARRTKTWYRTDSTNIPFRMSDAAVTDYVRQVDHWFDTVDDLLAAHGITPTRVSYEGLLEDRTDLPRLREAFADCVLAPGMEDPAVWAPSTAKQDRRTDGSVARILEEFGQLSDESQRLLLRYPGTRGRDKG
jgi:lipopolysaccharide biosynthesis glycosyltransferase/LPS sulfotransferase NodH